MTFTKWQLPCRRVHGETGKGLSGWREKRSKNVLPVIDCHTHTMLRMMHRILFQDHTIKGKFSLSMTILRGEYDISVRFWCHISVVNNQGIVSTTCLQKQCQRSLIWLKKKKKRFLCQMKAHICIITHLEIYI